MRTASLGERALDSKHLSGIGAQLTGLVERCRGHTEVAPPDRIARGREPALGAARQHLGLDRGQCRRWYLITAGRAGYRRDDGRVRGGKPLFQRMRGKEMRIELESLLNLTESRGMIARFGQRPRPGEEGLKGLPPFACIHIQQRCKTDSRAAPGTTRSL